MSAPIKPATRSSTDIRMPEGAEAADRAARTRAGVVAGATGRSAADIRRSIMAADVEGLPAGFIRNDRGSFRARLRQDTALKLTPGDSPWTPPANKGLKK